MTWEVGPSKLAHVKVRERHYQKKGTKVTEKDSQEYSSLSPLTLH